jgi:hypothetical protein
LLYGNLLKMWKLATFSRTVVHHHRSLVPIGELVDFAGR